MRKNFRHDTHTHQKGLRTRIPRRRLPGIGRQAVAARNPQGCASLRLLGKRRWPRPPRSAHGTIRTRRADGMNSGNGTCRNWNTPGRRQHSPGRYGNSPQSPCSSPPGTPPKTTRSSSGNTSKPPPHNTFRTECTPAAFSARPVRKRLRSVPAAKNDKSPTIAHFERFATSALRI